jgi:hypothetical protein
MLKFQSLSFLYNKSMARFPPFNYSFFERYLGIIEGILLIVLAIPLGQG